MLVSALVPAVAKPPLLRRCPMFERARFVLACSLFSAASAALPAGCASRHTESVAQDPRAAEPAAPADMTPESTIVEESDRGTITWSVTTEGRVEAIIK